MAEPTLGARYRKLRESAHKVWLAGVGAASTVGEGGGRFFEDLVERGRDLERRGKDNLRSARERVESTVEGLGGGLGERLDRRLDGVLHRMGVPDREEIRALTRRVERLTRQVEKLGWERRPVYHVLPGDDGEKGWKVALEGVEAPLSAHPTKDEALTAARDLAKNHEPSQVVVHKQDGSVQMQYAYGGTAA